MPLGAVPALFLVLHGEYAKRRKEYSILFILSLFCVHMLLEYVHVSIQHRGIQAEYTTRIPVATLYEYVNTYSPCRVLVW